MRVTAPKAQTLAFLARFLGVGTSVVTGAPGARAHNSPRVKRTLVERHAPAPRTINEYCFCLYIIKFGYYFMLPVYIPRQVINMQIKALQTAVFF